MYPLVCDLAGDGITVTMTCRVLGFSKQAFYKWQANPVTHREWDDAHLINAALDSHHDDPAFGYRFIADQLAERGIAASENRVQRLCTQQGIWSVFAKKTGLSRRAGPPLHDDLVDREFTATAANVRRDNRMRLARASVGVAESLNAVRGRRPRPVVAID